jgi:hypothetical protein
MPEEKAKKKPGFIISKARLSSSVCPLLTPIKNG